MKPRTSRLAIVAVVAALLLSVFATGVVVAQDRVKSPPGSAATQIGDHWIEITYSRPILRGRAGIFGSGDSYGTKLNAGAPVWRAGANATTRLKTEVDLEIGGTKVPAGEYSLFVELGDGGWTGIISKQDYMASFDRAKVQEGVTWGAYGYNADHDVARASMTVQQGAASVDQLTIVFVDVTAEGGGIAVVWDNQIGTLPFKVAE